MHNHFFHPYLLGATEFLVKPSAESLRYKFNQYKNLPPWQQSKKAQMSRRDGRKKKLGMYQGWQPRRRSYRRYLSTLSLQQPALAKSEPSLSWHPSTRNPKGLMLVPERSQATLHSYLNQEIAESFAPGRMRSFGSWSEGPALWLEMNDSHLSLCPMLWWVAGLLSELLWPNFTMVPLSISHLAGVASISSASSPVLADVRWKGRLAGGDWRFDISSLLPFGNIPLACKSDKPATGEDCYQISSLQGHRVTCFSSISFKTSMATYKHISQEPARKSLLGKATRGNSGFSFVVCKKVGMTHPPKYPWGLLIFLVIKKPLMSVKGNAVGVVQREGEGGMKVFNTLLSHRFHIQAVNGGWAAPQARFLEGESASSPNMAWLPQLMMLLFIILRPKAGTEVPLFSALY